MRAGRWLLVAAVVALLAGLSAAWSGRDEPVPAALGGDPLPVVRTGERSAGSTTWFCAAGRAETQPPAPTHLVLLTTVGDEAVDVRITAFGSGGSLEPAAASVAPGEVTVFDVGGAFGDPAYSILVESPSSQVAVEHRLTSSDAADADQAPCSTFSSSTWWFPAVTTTRDASALLTLFNPFPADAGIDVEVVLDTGLRTPTSLTGIVVPAGTVRVVDLGESVQRREQFAVVVRSRSGRVVAELAQSRDGGLGQRGLRLDGGVREPARRWAVAGGFTGPGVTEQLMLLNAGDERVTATVQVTPYGGASSPPEPLEVELPARRWVVLNLSLETRIPGDGYHSILVDSPDAPVVVSRTIAVGAPVQLPADEAVVPRPDVASGLAASSGTPAAALRWLVPEVNLVQPPPVVLVHNPGDGVAVVSVSVLTADGRRPVESADRIEIAPGDSLATPLSPETTGLDANAIAAFEVRASSPVVVERIVTFGPDELAIGNAVPIRFPRGALEVLDVG